MSRRIPGVIALFLLALATGCGDGKSTVHGTVTFDGKTVKSGSIVFESTDGELVREGAIITDGAFKTRMSPGKYTIKLHAKHVTGQRTQKGFDGKDEVLDLTEELFPDYFNTKSELIETIKPGDNPLTLNLKTRK